jgi:hypothetical protein
MASNSAFSPSTNTPQHLQRHCHDATVLHTGIRNIVEVVHKERYFAEFLHSFLKTLGVCFSLWALLCESVVVHLFKDRIVINIKLRRLIKIQRLLEIVG